MFLENKKKSKKSIYTKWWIYWYWLLFFLFLWSLSFSNVLAQNNKEAQDLSQEIQWLWIIPLIQQEPVQQEPTPQEININKTNQENSTFDSIFDFFKKIKNTDSIETTNTNNKEKTHTKTGKNQNKTKTWEYIITWENNISGNIITWENNTWGNIITGGNNNISIEENIQYNEKSFDYDVFLSDILAKYYWSYNYEEHLNPKLCHYTTGDIITIKPWKNNLPEYLSWGTIYKLRDGDYISDYMIKINNNCTMIIGSKESRLLTKNTEWATIKVISWQNNIFENLILEGEENWSKKPHIANNYWIYLNSSKNIINNITSFDQARFAIYMNSFENHIINSLFLKEPIILDTWDILLDTWNILLDTWDILLDNWDTLLDTWDNIKKLFLEKIIQDKYKQTKIADKINKKMQFSATNNPALIDTNKPIQEIESDLTWNLFTKEKGKFKWKSSLNLERSKWKIPIDIILESLDSKHKVHLKKDSILKKKNGNVYTWIFIIPEETTEVWYSSWSELSWSKLRSAETIKIWSFEEWIYITDNSWEKQEAIIEMNISWYKSWDNVEIFSSEDWDNWETLWYYEVQEKNGETFILIPTTHFSYITAGTYYWNYFKWSISIEESFNSRDFIADCHYQINWWSRYIAMWSPGWLPWSAICATTYNTTSNFNIRFRATVEWWLIEEPRSFLNPDMLLVAWITYLYGTTDTYYYDATAPSWWSFTINNWATYTKSTAVTLNITCPTDAGVWGVKMMFSHNWSVRTTPENCVSTKSYNLLAGEWSQTVYMKFLDALGNTTTNRTDSIIVDTVAPTSAPICTNNARFISSISVACLFGIWSDIIRYTTNGSTPTTSSPIWIDKSFTTTTTLKAISCDLANNCLTDPITTKLYTKDTSPPSWWSFSINDWASYTKSTSVTLDIFCPLDNWTPVQVAYGKSSSPTNRTTCTSSIAYTLSTTNWTQTAYVRFRDGWGNTSSDITDTIILDTVSPTYIWYSNLSWYVYNNWSDYWFTPWSELWVDISHADTRRTETQYFWFNKDWCSPNSCWWAPNEIKSYIYSTFTDRMYNDSYINIYSAACVDGDWNCTTDTDVTRRWKSSINTSIPDYNYRLHTFLYDAAKNWVWYTNLWIRIKIDGTIPTTTINSPAASSVQAENFNVSISDTDVRSWIWTCKYRILDNWTQSLWWTNRTCNSSISINIWSYCTTQWTNKCTIESYSIDNVWLLSTIQSRSFSIDTTAPTITISNPNTNPATSKTITASTNEGTLTMTAWSTSTTCDASRSFVAYASTTFSSEADNGKYVCYRAIDSVGNISYKLSNAIAGIDRTAPTTTNNANSTRRSSDFSVTLTPNETSTTKYCIGTSSCSPTIVGTTANVTCSAGTTCASQYVRYYSTDTAGNTESVKTSSQIRIDKQAPSFTFANASWPECVNGSLVITSASDGWVGLHSTPYSFNGSTWNTTTSTTITAQQPWTQNRTAYVRDALGNSTSKAATYTFTNVAPTANNFVGHSSVGNTPRTVNWKTLSSATEGSCGNSSISFNTVITQWTKGSCSVVGDNITYTPNTSQAWSDSCIIQLKDNENSTVNITVSWEGIDTTAPTAAPTCTSSQYFSSSVDIVCTVWAGWTVVRYTTNWVDPSPSDPLWLNQPFSSTTTLKAISCDALNNCNLTAVTTKIYTLDNLAPTSSISDTNSNRRNTNINFTLNSSDAGVWWITSYYKSLAGDVTCTAGWFTTYSTSVAVNWTAGQAIQRTICYYSTDSLLNIETIKKQLYKIDMSDPTISAPAIYWWTTYGNYFKWTISLRSSISDIWAGILASSCMRSINAWAWTNVWMTQDASYCMYNTYNPASSFNVKFLVKDQATNTGISLQSNFTYDNTAPTISTPTIYAGTTYNNTYYKGTISIQSTATDAWSNIDTNTCEYSLNNWSSRTSATYAWWYCQISNISPATNIQILIRAKDNLGTTETSSAKTYTYDATAPITTDNASSTRTNSDQTITLSPTDAWAGVANTYYCITNSGWTCTPNIAGTSILVTWANNEITNKQIRYYSTDNLNTDETIKTSAIINIDKQWPTIELLSPENNAGFNDWSSVQLQWSWSDNWWWISWYIYNILSWWSSIISWFTTNTAIIVSWLDIGIYEWSITAIDIIDNQTVSPERSFEIKQLNYVIIPDSEINADFITAFTEVGYIDSGDILIGSKDINLETSTNGKVCPWKSIWFISTGTLYSNNIEIELPTCFYVKKSNGNPYTGIIKIPEFINNIAPDNLLLNKSTITVGTWTESIFFKNESNNDINAIIRVPTPEKELGESVKIFYSEDGQVRNYLTSTIITSYNNQPYAIFENNHFTYFTVWAIQRNTDNYLNEEFWSNNPTDDQILKALYGIWSWSAYTQNWVNYNDNCTWNTVVYTGILPSEFSANTVYVLESGNYNITWPINVRNCAAIISSGTATMVSQAELSYLQFNWTKYAIIDNISKNWNNFYNSRWIWSVAAHSNTINNFKAYNNDNWIMLINWSHDNTVNNSYIYNNDNWLQIHDSSNNTVNNTKTYNNVGYGVGITRYSSNSSYNTINNIQSFNNWQGIYLYTNYVYQNTISNSSFYNNSNWINFTSSPQNNNLVNIELYNN